MPRGVWKDNSIAKRSAAARKGAQARNRRAGLKRFAETGEPMADAPRIDAQGKVAGVAISEAIARIRARETSRVPRETLGEG